MRREDALKKLSRLLGKNFRYRVDPTAPDADERAEAKARLPELNARLDELGLQRNERRKALLDADAEYQRLKAEYDAASKARSDAVSCTMHYRFTVGTLGELFFHVKAQGDSWEEVISKVKAGK